MMDRGHKDHSARGIQRPLGWTEDTETFQAGFTQDNFPMDRNGQESFLCHCDISCVQMTLLP